MDVATQIAATRAGSDRPAMATARAIDPSRANTSIVPPPKAVSVNDTAAIDAATPPNGRSVAWPARGRKTWAAARARPVTAESTAISVALSG